MVNRQKVAMMQYTFCLLRGWSKQSHQTYSIACVDKLVLSNSWTVADTGGVLLLAPCKRNSLEHGRFHAVAVLLGRRVLGAYEAAF